MVSTLNYFRLFGPWPRVSSLKRTKRSGIERWRELEAQLLKVGSGPDLDWSTRQFRPRILNLSCGFAEVQMFKQFWTLEFPPPPKLNGAERSSDLHLQVEKSNFRHVDAAAVHR